MAWRFLLLFFLLRLGHLTLFFFPRFFPDELLIGTITKGLLGGSSLSFLEYVEDYDTGGSFIYALCALPFFRLFGETIFSLRVPSLLFQGLTFLAWFFFMRRHFGGKAACFTSLLFLLPPPWLTCYFTYALGAHADSMLFTILGLHLLYRMLYEGEKHRSPSLLGLLLGFGTYYVYSTGVSVVCFLLFWFLHDRRFLFKREFRLFFLFFLVGFSPWLLYHALYPFRSLQIFREAFFYPHPANVAEIPLRLAKLLTLKLLGLFSLNYEKGYLRFVRFTPFNFVYYGAFFAAYAVLLRFIKKEKKLQIFFLFPLVYLLVAATSRLVLVTHGNRYLVPFYPFFFGAMALALIRAEEYFKAPRLLISGILGLLLAMGALGEWRLLSVKDAGLSMRYRGYSYGYLGWALSHRHAEDFDKVAALGLLVEREIPLSDRPAFHFGLSQLDFIVKDEVDVRRSLAWALYFDETYRPFYIQEIARRWWRGEGTISEKIRAAAKMEKGVRPYVVSGLVSSLSVSGEKPDTLLATVREEAPASVSYWPALSYALGCLDTFNSPKDSFLDKIRQRQGWEDRIPHRYRLLYYRGVGGLLVENYDLLFRKWPLDFEALLKGMDPRCLEALFWGAGFSAPLWYEDPFELERMALQIPPAFRTAFWQGVFNRYEWGGRNVWIEGPLSREF